MEIILDPYLLQPCARPTLEARDELVQAASRQGEESRSQIRTVFSASLKKGKYAKHSEEYEKVGYL